MNTLTRNSHYHDSALRQAWSIWKRRKWLAILAFIAPFSAAVSLVAGMPELYGAETTILVRQDTLSMSDAPVDTFEARLQSINEELLSRSRLQELIVHFDLYPDLRQSASSEQVVERMRRDIRLKQKKIDSSWGRSATVAFTLGYQSWDAQTAAEVTNALAAFYVEENERRRLRQEDIAVTSASAATGAATKLAELQRELTELRANYSEQYPDISRVKAEIAALKRQQAARKDITAFAAAADSAIPGKPEGRTPVSQHPGQQQFLILDPAVTPEDPFAPNRFRLMFMALILSAGFAGVVVLLIEQFDTSFHQRGDLWSYSNLPILASIPHILTRGDLWRRRLRYTCIGVLAMCGIVLLVQASHVLGQNAEQLVWMLARRGV